MYTSHRTHHDRPGYIQRIVAVVSRRVSAMRGKKRASVKRVQNVLNTTKKDNNKIQLDSYKLRVMYSVIILSFILSILFIHRQFRFAEFSPRYSYTVLIESPIAEGNSDRQLSILSLRGTANEVIVLQIPTEITRDIVGQLSEKNEAFARHTGFITDTFIQTNTPYAFDSQYAVTQLMLRGMISDEQVSTLKWTDRVSMMLYVFFSHRSDFKLVTVSVPTHCVMTNTSEDAAVFSRTDEEIREEQLGCFAAYATSTLIPRNMLDTYLTQHVTTVGVINQTGINGLAKYVSDIFKAHGFSVVHISSNGIDDTHSQIIVTSSTKDVEYAVAKIQKLFDRPIPVSVKPELFTMYRSDIVVVVGSDEWTR